MRSCCSPRSMRTVCCRNIYCSSEGSCINLYTSCSTALASCPATIDGDAGASDTCGVWTTEVHYHCCKFFWLHKLFGWLICQQHFLHNLLNCHATDTRGVCKLVLDQICKASGMLRSGSVDKIMPPTVATLDEYTRCRQLAP